MSLAYTYTYVYNAFVCTDVLHMLNLIFYYKEKTQSQLYILHRNCTAQTFIDFISNKNRFNIAANRYKYAQCIHSLLLLLLLLVVFQYSLQNGQKLCSILFRSIILFIVNNLLSSPLYQSIIDKFSTKINQILLVQPL